MSTIFYSVANAPTSIASFLVTMPHFIAGTALLCASWYRKCWIIKGANGTAGLIVQALFGAIFFFIPARDMTQSWIDTFACRTALREGNAATVTGTLTINKTFNKPGYGYIDFDIDGHSYRTRTEGITCDCGYIQSIGRRVLRAKNTQVKAQVLYGYVLSLESVP